MEETHEYNPEKQEINKLKSIIDLNHWIIERLKDKIEKLEKIADYRRQEYKETKNALEAMENTIK